MSFLGMTICFEPLEDLDMFELVGCNHFMIPFVYNTQSIEQTTKERIPLINKEKKMRQI